MNSYFTNKQGAHQYLAVWCHGFWIIYAERDTQIHNFKITDFIQTLLDIDS